MKFVSLFDYAFYKSLIDNVFGGAETIRFDLL